MSASEFLRKVSAAEIKQASDDSDRAEDEANGKTLEPSQFIERMGSRLANSYPGLYERIQDFVEGQHAISSDRAFVMGVMAGALMMAHDITIAAEVHDANAMFQDPPTAL